MNKFFSLLTLLTFSFGLAQDFKIDHSYTTANPPFTVGDTITIKYEILSVDGSTAAPKFLQFDYQYNNKLLTKIDHTWGLSSNTTAAKSLAHWDGYKYKVLDTYDANDLENQYLYGWAQRSGVEGDTESYPADADWSVERITVQDADSAIAFGTRVLHVRYQVKDRQSTGYDDYTHLTDFNWVRANNGVDTADADLYDVTWYNSTVNIDNQGNTTGVNSGAITFNLHTAAKADHAEDYKYLIYKEIDNTAVVYAEGLFDANGQATTSALEIDVEYFIEVYVNGKPDWLDDIITVTDVYLIFAQAIGAGAGPEGGDTNTFTYLIQNLLGDVNGTTSINFDDSYIALGHVQGVADLGSYFSNATTGAYNRYGPIAVFGGEEDGDIGSYGRTRTFKPTDAIKTFDIAHAHGGDVDFSHSYTPTVEGASYQTPVARPTLTQNAMGTPIEANLDITTELIEGKVHLTVDLQEEGLVGTQFNIKYDNIVLILDDVIFDTGNDMTNISTHYGDQSLVRVGSIDPDGDSTVKLGKSYKLIFTPTETITNTAGLVSFDFTEGVKADGTKVKFIIK